MPARARVRSQPPGRAPPNLVPLRIGDIQDREVGSSVHAIGHPEGNEWSYTHGVISQIRFGYKWPNENNGPHTATVIQTQTPINPSSSGGPLLDDKAKIIGVNAFIFTNKQGLNFAISVDDIKKFMDRRGDRDPEPPSDPQPPKEGCKPEKWRQYPALIDPVTKKKVIPFDTLCIGRPEYLLRDRVGDGKIDIKVVYRFGPDLDLWIFYGMRNEIPTMFGYDYGRKGRPERLVPISTTTHQ
jgi:hypothetical protein